MKRKEDRLTSHLRKLRRLRKLRPWDWFVAVRELSLEDWLAAIRTSNSDGEYDLPSHRFLTDEIREQYLDSIHERSEEDVRDLIRRFLIPAGWLDVDLSSRKWLMNQPNRFELVEKTEYYRRLLHISGPWEGTAWILDLLPDNASMAWNVINAFLAARLRYIPEGHADGLFDVLDIIQAKYLERDNPRETLLRLNARDFEYFIAATYRQIGYDIILTPPTRDGGFDVKIRRAEAGLAEISLVECKLYEDAVGVEAIRNLHSAIEKNNANRGILVTTGRVTVPGREWAEAVGRIDIVDYKALNKLLNRAFGADWPRRVGRQIVELQREIAFNTENSFLLGKRRII